jgi:hypothetical protein
MLNIVAISSRSVRTIMSQAGEFFCQACGRHTSHAAEKRKQANIQYTPPKYCSKRCKSTGEPSLEIVQGWKRLLDDASVGGKRQVVLCLDVQRAVFDEAGSSDSGTESDVESPDKRTNGEQSQQLGMKKAKNREDTRRAARLIYHFGFQHFQAKPLTQEPPVDIEPSPKKKRGKPTDASEKASDRQLEAMQNGKLIHDVTHAKGEWGLRYKA